MNTLATGIALFELMIGCWTVQGERTSLVTGQTKPLQGFTQSWIETDGARPVPTLISANRFEDPATGRTTSRIYWLRPEGPPAAKADAHFTTPPSLSFELGYVLPDTTPSPPAGRGVFTDGTNPANPARFVSEQSFNAGDTPYLIHSETVFENSSASYTETLSHGDAPLAKTKIRYVRTDCP